MRNRIFCRSQYEGRALRTLILAGSLSLAFSSCVNKIDDAVVESDIPISFTARLSRSTSTRIADNSFEQGDRIGLFAVLESYSLSESRYLDNLLLTYSEDNVLIPEREVFYPEGGSKLDFTAYHPFRPEGMELQGTSIPVKVETDQTSVANHTASDFLVAVKEGVSSSEHAVALTFRHKFAKIKIEMLPQGNENVDDMETDNPQVVMTGFKTGAVYDFATDDIYSLSAEADIVPWGSWKKEGNKLVGKEGIVIPQPMSEGKQSFVLEWNGKVYTCPIPVLELKENTQYTIQINAEQLDDTTLEGITADIEEWTDDDSSNESDSGYLLNAVHVTPMTFSSSNVYRVYSNGKAVAEICREYLVADTLHSRAIVVYPVKDEVSQLEEGGTVLRLLDVDGDVHGGKVRWNIAQNTLDYEPGSSAPIDYFFINSDNKVTVEEASETSVPVSVSAYLLRDTRGGTLQTYSLVKVGTQYWMRTNLKATAYRNGTALERETEMTGTPCYMLSDNGKMFFYSGEALLAGELAPEGWKIPTVKEWKSLRSYIGDDMSVLKADTDWQELKGGDVTPHSNLSNFGLYPVGIWTSGQVNMYQTTVLWYFNEDGLTLPDTIDYINGDSNIPLGGTSARDGLYKGFSIRCIKE